MTEQLPAGRAIFANVFAVNTPGELFATHTEGTLMATLDPPALYLRNEGQWVPLASVAGNIPAPTVVGASEDTAGVAELATQEETNNGSDTFRIVTPAGLSGRTATEIRTGLVELATAAETADGTDGTRAVHPAGMKGAMAPEAWTAPTLLNGWVSFGSTFAALAYRKEPGGLVRLRGHVKSGTRGSASPIFVLPSGYRPPADLIFLVENDAGSSMGLVVEAGGNVFVFSGGVSTRVSLNQVVFGV